MCHRYPSNRCALGMLPGCGDDVAPDAGALAYRGGFYHLVCALWHRECRRSDARRRRVTSGRAGRATIPDISLRNADAQTRLATYLNDHLGGSATGRELARRTLSSNRGNEYGVVLEDIARQIEEDVDSLLDVMRRLDVEPDRIKEAIGWAAREARAPEAERPAARLLAAQPPGRAGGR